MRKNTVLISLVLLLAALCAAASAGEGVPVDEEHFPNDRFRAYVAENKDLDGDGILSAEEIESADTIGIYDSFLESLEGVEYFTNLQHLICFSNQYLKKLDVSKNTRLEELDCHNCQLSSLKLGGCQNLKKLHCETNRLKSLDVKATEKRHAFRKEACLFSVYSKNKR
ncbi:MAG: leucine-rich repeat domain-containing protein [Clostridia bacterium]|nr:leucine-rich repeat domain-containing protein [Clostridia bacterium]